MSRITIIKDDNVVCVNGRCLSGIDMSSMPDNLHAMQWYETHGEEERFNFQTGRPFNVVITSLDNYSDVLSQWETKRLELDTPPTSPPEPIVPSKITRRQCARQLFSMGLITGDEAVAMTQTGTPPAMVQQYIDSLQGNDRIMALIDFAADSYFRDNPLLAQIAAVNNMSSADLDAFFIAASAEVTTQT